MTRPQKHNSFSRFLSKRGGGSANLEKREGFPQTRPRASCAGSRGERKQGYPKGKGTRKQPATTKEISISGKREKNCDCEQKKRGQGVINYRETAAERPWPPHEIRVFTREPGKEACQWVGRRGLGPAGKKKKKKGHQHCQTTRNSFSIEKGKGCRASWGGGGERGSFFPTGKEEDRPSFIKRVVGWKKNPPHRANGYGGKREKKKDNETKNVSGSGGPVLVFERRGLSHGGNQL